MARTPFPRQIARLAAALCLLSVSVRCSVVRSEGAYPRAVQLRNGSVLACVDAPDGRSQHAIFLLRSDDAGATFASAATVRTVAAVDGVQLTNCHLAETQPGVLMLAYRHHSNCSSDACGDYRIEASLSSDGGRTWAVVKALSAGKVRVWEPFVFPLPEQNAVAVAYAQELQPQAGRREQNIVWQLTTDNGTSWSAPSVVAHNDGSRNGMPGMARLHNGTLVAVFEGFWEAWGDFSVSYALSHDGGRTWINRQKLYDPPGAAMAGAPQVAVDSSGRVYASCMTNDMDGPDFPNWDERTGVRVFIAMEPAKLNFGSANITVAPPSAYWPGLVAIDGAIHALYQNSTPSGGVPIITPALRA